MRYSNDTAKRVECHYKIVNVFKYSRKTELDPWIFEFLRRL